MYAEKAFPRHLLIPVIADTRSIADPNEMPSIHNKLNKGFLRSSPANPRSQVFISIGDF